METPEYKETRKQAFETCMKALGAIIEGHLYDADIKLRTTMLLVDRMKKLKETESES
jgi:hypothetical protein